MKPILNPNKEPTPETQIEYERRAERTLLATTRGMEEEELSIFLEEINLSRPEYDYIVDKYSRILDRMDEEEKSDD